VQRSQHLIQAGPRGFSQGHVANCPSVGGQADLKSLRTIATPTVSRTWGSAASKVFEEALEYDSRACELASEFQAPTAKESTKFSRRHGEPPAGQLCPDFNECSSSPAPRTVNSGSLRLENSYLRQGAAKWILQDRSCLNFLSFSPRIGTLGSENVVR
jgi:hypothetical protein